MKIKYLFGAVCALALGLSSCSETKDDSPVFVGHEGEVTANFLNIPQMQSAPVMITQENRNANFNLTCSQPDFGYAAAAAYQVQVSKTEDFAEYREIKQRFYNCAQINPLYHDMAGAIEYLNDVKSEANLPLEYQTYYVRLKAFIPQSESNSVFLSNVVKFDALSADYLAIWVPDQPKNIYLRGNLMVNGVLDTSWNAFTEYQFVTGTGEDTWVLDNVTLTTSMEFKIADDAWGLDLGADKVNPLVPDGTKDGKPTKLGEKGANLKVSEDFTGKIVLSLTDGSYYVKLIPVGSEAY